MRKRYWRIAALGAALLALGAAVFFFAEDPGYTVTTYSMGSYVKQTVYGKKREEAARQAAGAVSQLDGLLSWRIEGSDAANINRQAGKGFAEIDPRTEELLLKLLPVCEASGGAFDVTIAPVSRLWDFDGDPHLPDSDLIEKQKEKVDCGALSVPGDGTAALAGRDMAVDLGAVGKGAACDQAVAAYEESGADRAIVAVGGSVGVYGAKPFGRPWNIAVRDPAGDGSLGTLALESGFVSTSGSYEKCFTEDGVTYHHLLDPSTGYPAESGLLSVTVWSGSGAMSDALSTACFVLGLEKSRPLLERFDAQAVFVTEDGRVLTTPGLADRFALTAEGYALEALP